MHPKDVAKNYDSIAERWDSCGASGRILDLLLEHGFEAEGLDLSERMIELARRRHPQVMFYHADICEWEFPARYDFISAWDSIWHIPLDEHERVLSKILSGLSPGGVCIFTTGGVDAASEKRDAAMGVPMYHSAPGIPKILEILADSGCACRHLEYDQYPELHVYIIAQRMETTV